MKPKMIIAVGAVLLMASPVTAAFGQQPPSQSQTTQSQPQSGGSQTGVTIASDSLLGTKVRDAQGKELGEVSKLMIDAQQGKVETVVITQGGTLGMGGKEISVPWSALQVQRGQDQKLVVTMQQEMLQQTPAAQQKEQREQQPAASPPTNSEQRTQPKQQQ